MGAYPHALTAGEGMTGVRKTKNGLGRGNSKSLGKNTGILESMAGVDFVPALNAAQEAVDAQEAPYLGGVSLSPTVKMEFDLDQIEYMARQHCSFKEIAQFYRCSEATIQLRYKEDTDFRAAMDKGRFHTVEIIRRKQIESATAGNPQMLMWLGKQMLGQTEKADVDKMSRAQPINIQINAPVSIESDKIDPIDLTPDDYSAND